MCDRIMELPDRSKFQILAPVVKGTHRKLLSSQLLKVCPRSHQWRSAGTQRLD